MSSDVTTTTNLLPFQQAALQDLLQRTREQVDKPGGAVPIYQGERVAGLTPDQIAAQNTARTYATGAGTNSINTAIDANTFWSDPNRVFDLKSVPGYDATKQGIETSVGRLLTDKYLPSITGGAIANNQLSNNRLGLAQGEAAGRSAEALASQLGQLDLGTAQMLLGANQSAIARAPQLTTAGTIPSDILGAIGAQNQTLTQANIDAERQKFEETANSPYFGLDQLRASMGLIPGGTGTTSQDTSSPSWWQTLASLGLLGKSLLGSGTINGIGGPIQI